MSPPQLAATAFQVRRFLLLASLFLTIAGATAEGVYAEEHCAKPGEVTVETGDSTARSVPRESDQEPAPENLPAPAAETEHVGHGDERGCCAGSCLSCCVREAGDASAAVANTRPDPERDHSVSTSPSRDRAPRQSGRTIRPGETWDLPPPGPALRLLHSSFLI